MQKSYWWEGYERLTYEIQVRNVGSQSLENVWITDTYPVSTTFNGDWWNNGPWVTYTHDLANHQIVFWVERLNPGDTANIGFRLDLDGNVIGQQGLAFTNRLDAPIAEDVFPSDNHYEVTATTGPDVYIEKQLSEGVPEAGEMLTYTVAFGNSNPGPWTATRATAVISPRPCQKG